MKLLILLASSGALALTVAGCGSKTAEEEVPAPVALVEIAPATAATLTESLDSYGTTEFAASHVATLAVQMESQVAEVFVTAGAHVHRGQALLRLVPSATATLDLHKAQHDAESAVAELARQQRLRADGLAAESELQAAKAAAASATALRDSLGRRAGTHEQLTLTAPRDGVVDLLTAQPGDILTSGAAAVRISQPDALQVRLGVDPKDAARLAAGQPVTLWSLTPGSPAVTAKLANVDLRVDPQSRMIGALVALPASSALLPGAAVHARIAVAEHKSVVSIPRSALMYEDDAPYVFLAVDHKAKRKDVTLGIDDGERVEVTAGLKAGEPIVVAGNSVLQDGMALRTADAKEKGSAESATTKDAP